MQPDEGPQKQIDFVRGEQLRILRDACLPTYRNQKDGKGITPIMLKSVLRAVDDFARGRVCTASVDSLAGVACVSRRHCMRCLEALTELGLLCHDEPSRWGKRGSPTVSRRIVWSELALLCDRGLWQSPRQTSESRPIRVPPGHFDGGDQSALGADQSALGADQSALGADQSALGADQSAPRGTQYDNDKRLLSAFKAPSSVVVGARKFSWDETAAVLAKANTLHERAGVHSEADRDLVLKIAVLWESGQLAEDMMRQVLESYQRKAEAGDPVKDGQKWLWRCVWNQCRQNGLRFEKLLAQVVLPAEILAWRPPKPVLALVEAGRRERQAESAVMESELEDLEERFGETLDALSPEERETLHEEAGILPALRDKPNLSRPTLLRVLAERSDV